MSNNLPGAIADTEIPDYALFNPLFASGSNWASMTGTLQGVSLLPGGDVSDQYCNVDGEVALVQLVGAFHAAKDLADQICEAIPDPVVIVLGEGTKVPLKEVCYGINLIIGAFNSAASGLLDDCKTTDDLVDAAFIEAGYNNTLAIYNLEFRLSVEENLNAPVGTAVGIFELPNSQGGFLEQVRAVTADTVNLMAVIGVQTASAQNILLQGDALFNAHNYKQAYKSYQQAYKLVCQ